MTWTEFQEMLDYNGRTLEDVRQAALVEARALGRVDLVKWLEENPPD